MARILLVENDHDIRKSVAEILQPGGHRVFIAPDGLQALSLIFSGNFHLAIVDVDLPHLKGTALLDLIRKRNPQTMVIMISGPNDINDALESFNNGAYAILKKPLEALKILESVGNALTERRLMKSSGYIYKDRRKTYPSVIKRGAMLGIIDSLMVGLAFLAASIVYPMLPYPGDQPLSGVTLELLQMSLGLSFCYAFTFVLRRSHRLDFGASGAEIAWNQWRNLTQAYLLFAAVMFLTREAILPSIRAAVVAGYLAGYLLLIFNRFILVPGLSIRIRREGKKSIVIVGSGKPEAAGAPARRDYSTGTKGKPGVPRTPRNIPTGRDWIGAGSGEFEEITVDSDVFSPEEVLDLLNRFEGRKLKVVVKGGSAGQQQPEPSTVTKLK